MTSTFSLNPPVTPEVGDSVTYDEATLESMTKTDLISLAGELGVEGITSKSTKAEIITAILSR